MFLNDPLFFVVKHPDKKIELYFLGIDHLTMHYNHLPFWCQEKINSMDILFHEGNGPVVFIDPFSTTLSYTNPKWHYNWFDKLNQNEQTIIQKIIDLYCKNVKGPHFSVPLVDKMRFWCIDELVLHFDYFYNGHQIDYILHNKFFDTNKKVISLDESFSRENLRKRLHDEYMAFSGSYDPIPRLKEDIKAIENYFETGNFVSEEAELEPNYSNFHFLIEYGNDFAVEDPSYLPNRNIQWLDIISETINAKQSIEKNQKALVLCGCAHLSDLFARLMFKGFSICHITHNQLLPLPQQTLDLIHSYRLYHETYQNLKSEIVGESYAPIDWLRKIKTNQALEEQHETKSDNFNHHPNCHKA